MSTNHEAMDDALLLALIDAHLELDDDSRLRPLEPRDVDPAGLISRFQERVAREEQHAQLLLAYSLDAALTMGDDERFAVGSPSVGEVAHARAVAWTMPAAAPASLAGEDAVSVGRPLPRLFDVAAIMELASSGLRRAVGRSDALLLPTRYLLPAAPRVRAVETTPSLGPPELAAVWDWQSSIASLRPDAIQLSFAAPPRLHVGESGQLRWQRDRTVGGSREPAPRGYEPAPSQRTPRLLNDPSPGENESATYRVRRRIKSVFDLVAAALALVVLSPLLLLIAVVVRLTSRGPALFTQPRVGQNGKVFRIIKFRTMYENAEWRLAESLDNHDLERGVLRKMTIDPRLTPVGRLLRRLSINEFPQFINVLNGSMSIVGPRPPLPNEACRYGHTLQRRLRVKPGLTGLWQVSGRGDLCWEEAVLLDLRYIDEWSLRLDAKIIWSTFRALPIGAY